MCNTNLKFISQKIREAKIPNFWAKMGQLPLWYATLKGHNLAIFHPILIFFFILLFLRRFERSKKLSSVSFSLGLNRFWTLFLHQGLTWAMLSAWTQNHPQVVGMHSGHQPKLISQNQCSKNISYRSPLKCPFYIQKTRFFVAFFPILAMCKSLKSYLLFLF